MATRMAVASALLGAADTTRPARAVDKQPAAVERLEELPGGFEEYVRTRYADRLANVDAVVARMQTEPTFDARERLSAELECLQRDTFFLAPYGGFRAADYLEKKARDLSPEQRQRLRALANRFDPHQEPFVVPPVNAPFDRFCAEVGECVNHELRLDVSPETLERLRLLRVEIPEGGERMWDVVNRLRETGGLRLVLSRNGVALTDADVPEPELLATDGKAALFLHPGEEGKPQRVSMAYEPGSGGHFLHAEKAEVHSGPVNRLVIAPPDGMQTLINVHKKIYTPSPSTRTDAWNSCIHWYAPFTEVTLHPTRTYLPTSQRMPFGQFESVTCGMQHFTIVSVDTKDGRQAVTLRVNSWTDKPWSETPYEEDRSRYLWGGGAAIRFLDEHGTELSAEEGVPCMKLEALTRVFSVPEGAAEVEVVTHQAFGKDRPYFFAFPSEQLREEYMGEHGMPPAMRKIKTPAHAEDEEDD